MDTSTTLGTFSKGVDLRLSGSGAANWLESWNWLRWFNSNFHSSDLQSSIIKVDLNRGLSRNISKWLLNMKKCSTSLVIRKMQLKPQWDTSKCQQDWQKINIWHYQMVVRCVCTNRNTQIVLWVCTLVQPLWKSVWHYFKTSEVMKLWVHYSVIP